MNTTKPSQYALIKEALEIEEARYQAKASTPPSSPFCLPSPLFGTLGGAPISSSCDFLSPLASVGIHLYMEAPSPSNSISKSFSYKLGEAFTCQCAVRI